MIREGQSRGTAAAAATAISDPIEAALDLRARGHLEEALNVLVRSAQHSPDLYTLRGELQLELGQVEEALDSYDAVLALDPDNTYAHHQRAQCLHRLKRWDAAAEAYRAILSYDSHRDQARIGLGDCLLHLNRIEEALGCFDQCWSEAARMSALFGKAVALQLLRRFDEAESTYERVLALDPRAEEALSNLIAMNIEVFDLTRIHRYSARLLKVRPKSVVALQGLVLVALEREEYEAAARHYSRLLEQTSENDGFSGEHSPGEDSG